MRPRLWRWPLWRWTVSHQILILVAVSILAAQAAGLIVLLTMPARPPGGVAMEQAVGRIREAVREVALAQDAEADKEARAASDRRLVFTVIDAPPPAAQDPFSNRLAEFVAQSLNIPATDVRMMDFGPGPGGPGGRRFMRREGPPADQGPLAADDMPPGRAFGSPGAQPGPPPEGFGPPSGGPTVTQRLDRAVGELRPPGFGGGPGFRDGGRRQLRELRVREFLLRGRRGLAVKAGSHWVVVRSGPAVDEGLWLRQVGLTFGLTLAALLLPALWIAAHLARRIGAFAEAADRFGRNPDAPALPEQGPYELRQAAGAFNRMQARIQRLVSDRTMMMAAVSHDLRTPLARVRFRITELDPAVRDAIAEEIQQMDELIGQMLSFTRDALPNAERRKFDLSALAQSLVDDLSDAGQDVTFAGPEKLTVEANLAAVRRVLSNLLDNALKYAGHARLVLKVEGDVALAMVEDEGPGVPVGMEEAIFEPFRRVEPSRNRKTGGVGLGLAIARNLARGHGGDIVLEQAAPQGARFVFSLPLA
ncbi:MAG: ATP-binding protein [Caulobacteraceae bacterium]